MSRKGDRRGELVGHLPAAFARQRRRRPVGDAEVFDVVVGLLRHDLEEGVVFEDRAVEAVDVVGHDRLQHLLPLRQVRDLGDRFRDL